jgi:hypothetical protein
MSAPRTIADLLARDLTKGKIEEIVKVDQVDEHSVFTELTEYIATDRLREHYRHLFKAMAEYRAQPHEGTGVWVSGFFGSGKSSFAKNIGYVVGNRTVLSQRASDLFKKQLDDQICESLIDVVNLNVPTEVVMFDVQTDRASGGSGSVSISHYMYRSLLRALDYAEDFDIAELEQSLEYDRKLDDFIRRFEERYGDWRKRRKMAQKMNEASAILNDLDPGTYPQADSWAKGLAGKQIEATPALLVERTFDLAARRRPGKTIMFVVDEVGAYVARSAERIEDLRKVVEEFGKTSKNRVKANKAAGPVWVIVTSQEKLDEVVAAIDSKRVELAKLQDRFPLRVDLAPADIREVATKRVLGKNEGGYDELKGLYGRVEGQLNNNLRLEWPAGRTAVSESDFIEFYPYPPHFVDLSIDIMSGVRLQPGAPRHLGGSNRTIIKQAYEMLVSDRTSLARADVGRLVTMDLVFELVEGNLSTEKQKDISDVAAQFGQDAWPTRVAKAIALLEFVRTFPRTEENLAGVLVDSVSTPARPLAQVQAALDVLWKAKFVRRTEEGYKLQTDSEKSWETQRRSHDPKPKEKNEALREVVAELFSEPSLRSYAHKGLRTLKVGLSVDGSPVEEGHIPVHLVTSDVTELSTFKDDIQTRSRQQDQRDRSFWVAGLTPDISNLLEELCRSRHMVSRYELLRGQGKITAEESTCLATEKNEVLRYQNRLRDLLSDAVVAGTGYFQGVPRDGSSLGKTVSEVFRRWFEVIVPGLYPKLEMGARVLKGAEAEDLLKAANLSGLSQVFYEGPDGLGLVRKEGARYVMNESAPIAREVLNYIEERTRYGERVNGQDLVARFSGLGYGWDREIIQLVAAALLRAGAVEVTYQGRRFRGHQDALSRATFATNAAFRSSAFSPRETIGLKVLTTAAERFEELTGQEVEIEEGAIAAAFKKLAVQEREALLPVLASARAFKLPVEAELAEFDAALQSIAASPSDDSVRDLAGQGKSLKESFGRVRKIREALGPDRLATIERSRAVLQSIWPALESRGKNGSLSEAATQLRERITSSDFYESFPKIIDLTSRLDSAYETEYGALHDARRAAIQEAIEVVQADQDWASVPEDMRAPLLAPLVSRLCTDLDRGAQASCRRCGATLGQLESDIAAAPALRAAVIGRIQEVTRPKERVERVRLSQFGSEALDSDVAVERLVENVKQHLLKLVAEGVRIIVE